jgi:hypothetical protein
VHISDRSEIEVHPWRSMYSGVDARSRVVWSSNACFKPLRLNTPWQFSDLNGSDLTVPVSQDAKGWSDKMQPAGLTSPCDEGRQSELM